jgi:hypothetical protein
MAFDRKRAAPLDTLVTRANVFAMEGAVLVLAAAVLEAARAVFRRARFFETR